MKEISYKVIWDALSKINVNEHIETKGAKGGFQAKYLSWSWAWETLMNNFPQARFEFTQYEKSDGTLTDVLTYDDGTCQVECTMWIGELKRTMWLSVMDNMFNAIPNPSSSQINTAKMRCLAKLIAFWGLGFYIYAGEDLPQQQEEPKPTKKPAPKKKVTKKATNSTDTSVRAKALAFIQEHKGHQVFDEMGTKAIDDFLSKVTADTDDSFIMTARDRMEKLIYKHEKGE